MNAPQSPDEGRLRSSAERMRQELDRWLEAVWTQGERAMDAIGIRPEAVPIDVIECADSIVIRANVPGLSGQDLDVSLAGHMLTLKGDIPQGPTDEGNVHVRERPTGRFQRSIPLPSGVDPETIQAECRNGVLEITVSRLEREKARQVPVRTVVSTLETESPTG